MRRKTRAQSAIPTTTVTDTTMIMVVFLLKPPLPPPAFALAVVAGPGRPVPSVVNLIDAVASGSMVLLSVMRTLGFPLSVETDVTSETKVVDGSVTVVVDTCVASAAAGPVLANFRPGVRGCVSSILRSASTHRVFKAGPSVPEEPAAVAARANPHTPPRKSLVSVVHVWPLGTQYAAVSPGAMTGNLSLVRVFVTR